MKLYAFDVDGTLESSAGPVLLQDLRDLVGDGDTITTWSPSPNAPDEWPKRATGDRLANLLACQQDWPQAERYIYVSDNGDEAVAAAAGFEFVHPQQWALADY